MNLYRLLFLLLLVIEIKAFSSPTVYLSYQNDPSSSIVVHWIDKNTDSPQVYYQKKGSELWESKEGKGIQFKDLKDRICSVPLCELSPGQEYQFKIGENETLYFFKTLSSDPFKFVIGGDAYRYLSSFRKMNRVIQKMDPDFIVVGGDMAYVHGITHFKKNKIREMKRWKTFLKEWMHTMVGGDGRIIPMVPIVGNHDVKREKPSTPYELRNHLFYSLFALDEGSSVFKVFDIGSHFSLLLLDTGHLSPIEGKQTEWLNGVLQEREAIAFKIAAYHVGAYPSVYRFDGKVPQLIRDNWCPLFEKYRLNVAFEHHNHAYKRTVPLVKGASDPMGVVYLGDGCWGAKPRKPKDYWYLDKTAAVNHICLVSVSLKELQLEIVDNEGKTIDFWKKELK